MELLVDPNEKCAVCGHEYKFHIDVLGTAQACDVEVEGRYSGGQTMDPEEGPQKCGCSQFTQEADPEDFVNEVGV